MVRALERLEVLHDLGERDTDRRRVGEQPVDEWPQLAFAIATRRSQPGVGGQCRETNVPMPRCVASTPARSSSAYTLATVLALMREVDGELSHGRQPIADGQPPCRDRRADAAIELRVEWESDRSESTENTVNTIVLVQWYNVKRTVDRWTGGPVADVDWP